MLFFICTDQVCRCSIYSVKTPVSNLILLLYILIYEFWKKVFVSVYLRVHANFWPFPSFFSFYAVKTTWGFLDSSYVKHHFVRGNEWISMSINSNCQEPIDFRNFPFKALLTDIATIRLRLNPFVSLLTNFCCNSVWYNSKVFGR